MDLKALRSVDRVIDLVSSQSAGWSMSLHLCCPPLGSSITLIFGG